MKSGAIFLNKNSNFITVIVATLITLSQTVDYCNKELCKNFKFGRAKHIACNNNFDFSPQCPKERSVVPMTQERINLLLKLHNQFRSDVANGKVRGYKQADQMIEMVGIFFFNFVN